MQCVFLSQFCAFYGLLLILNHYHGSENSSSVRQFFLNQLGTGAVIGY